ncbi:LytTR family DNA-binding domain-containing protein [Phenylobacterium sp.]|uniref:LytTR family DNA-binding domain-containing protein n=1 Tax=Phenylobacterium sp. TaxID=1871053 RepID=UPI0025D161D4|nr:LytTR family DNA-binding domain-containing protein [Phenylobacterium sp.]
MARITRSMLLRMLGAATLISLFVTLLGPLHATPLQWAARAGTNLFYGWAGCLLGLACARLVARTRIWDFGAIPSGAATGLLMMPVMSAVVWTTNTLGAGRPPPLSALPEILWYVTLICIGVSSLAILVGRSRALATSASATPPKFLERLPLKLRGAEVWAVEAEDHYLRLHTSKGQDLILMRLADAIAELEGIEGAQVHRSWWVARDAIADARRGDGRAVLTLKDGSEAPVSRTYAGLLRERGWI